jgi:hypothetical protein
MGTKRTFQNMLNEFLTYDLMKEQLIERDWFLQNVEHDSGWKGGTLPVPFYGTQATSIKMGGLTSSNDVSKHKYVRGSVTDYKEAWGTLRFEHRDLMEQDGAVNEKSFLKILPGQVEDFSMIMKEQMSKMLLSGSVVATATSSASNATGVFTVDRVERFHLDQKVILIDSDSAQIEVYVININLNTNQVTFSLTRGGAFANLLAYTVANSAKFWYDGVLVGGVETNGFSHLKGMLLSQANGGLASLYGQSKLLYPYLQALNIDGSSVSSSNIKLKLFSAYNEIRQKARGNANTILMSFKWMGHLMAQIEDQKGAFKVTVNSEKASLYGWTEITITSVKGTLKVVAIQEMDDDCILFLDMAAMKFYSNGEMMRKRTAPDGKQYYEVREDDGYFYLVDICTFGELILHAPTKCGILYGIPA